MSLSPDTLTASTAKTVRLVITNNSDDTFIYGEQLELEFYSKGSWSPGYPFTELAFEIAYSLEPGESVTKDINLQPLEKEHNDIPGQYRFGKQFIGDNGTKKLRICADFTMR